MSRLLWRGSVVGLIYGAVLLLFFLWRLSSPLLFLSRSPVEEAPPVLREEREKKVLDKENKEITVSLQVLEELKASAKAVDPPLVEEKSAPRANNSPAKAKRKKDVAPSSGEFPQIVARYDALGFSAYLQALAWRAGARVFVGDMHEHKLRAELVPGREELQPVGSLQGLALERPRIVSDPEAEPYLQGARQRFGPGSYEVVVLFPQGVEQWMVEQLAQQARRQGLDPSALARFEGHYRLSGGNLVLVITEAVEKGGRVLPLSVRLTFRGVTRG